MVAQAPSGLTCRRQATDHHIPYLPLFSSTRDTILRMDGCPQRVQGTTGRRMFAQRLTGVTRYQMELLYCYERGASAC